MTTPDDAAQWREAVQKSPEQIACDIVHHFSWTANVMLGGKLVAQQVMVAAEIAAGRERFSRR